jgi:hypothetical protein
MSVPAILVIVLLLALLGILPAWPYSSNWGYYPSVITGAGLIVLIGLLLVGRFG